MTISENLNTGKLDSSSENLELFKEVAKKFVESIISQAAEEVATKYKHQRNHESPTPGNLPVICIQPSAAPQIQIDLVGSNATSPDDSLIPWASNSEHRGTDEESGDMTPDAMRDTSEEGNELANNEMQEKRRQELHAFALEYVKEIIAKATSLATEREQARQSLRAEVSLMFQTISDKSGSETWFARLRTMLNRIMRTTCFCKTRDNSPTEL